MSNLSDIAIVSALCKKDNTFNLAQGSCMIRTEELIINEACKVIRKGENQYSEPQGLMALREAICLHLNTSKKISVNPNQVVVTNGASSGIALSLLSLFNAGDSIIIIEPYWDYHYDLIRSLNLKPLVIKANEINEELTIDVLTANANKNTKGIIVCNPSNPSGKVYTKKEIDLIIEFARLNKVKIISDETYSDFTYERMEYSSYLSNYTSNAIDIVVAKSFSKTYAVTGWRVGYVISKEEIANDLKVLNGLFNACAPTPLQFALVKALKLPSNYYTDLKQSFQSKRDSLLKVFEEVGLPAIKPDGGLFIMVDSSTINRDSMSASMILIKSVGVGAVPCRNFFLSDRGTKYLRFCFAVEDHIIEKAVDRLMKIV